MTENEMVERVARKLAAGRYALVGGPDSDSLVRGQPNWTFCVDDARTAIEALREPIITMGKWWVEEMQRQGTVFDNVSPPDYPVDLWGGIIDAALSQETGK